MKKTFVVPALAGLLLACTVHAAVITSKEGKTVEAEVISYKDGVFTIEKDGKEHVYPLALIERIDFKEIEKEPPTPNMKIDIRRMSTVVSKRKGLSNDIYDIKPSIQIDCRCHVEAYRQRPLVVLRMYIQESKTGVIKESVFWYNWEKDTGWASTTKPFSKPCDPQKTSAKQPQCDWERLSPITLAELDLSYSPNPLQCQVKPKVLAMRAEVWLGGRLVVAENKQKDYHFPLPSSWK